MFLPENDLNLSNQLIDELTNIPETWALTPVKGDKRPYRKDWQKEAPLSRDTIAAEIKSARAKGYGIRTGEISGGILAIDVDGNAAEALLQKVADGDLPDTVIFTSGKPGRRQLLYLVPEEYWGIIKTIKLKTGVKGDDGNEQQLEIRWNGCQSVLPPSVHPQTGNYYWVRSPIDVEVTQCPMWVIELMLNYQPQQKEPQIQQSPLRENYFTSQERWTNMNWAISYLNALHPSRADDYDTWLKVGMALKSVDEFLLSEWDNWSKQSSKYKPGSCQQKWDSFKSSGINIGSIAHWAKEDGWVNPFSTDYQQRPINANENRSVTGDSDTFGDTSNPHSTRFTAIVTSVTEILDLGFTDYEEQQLLEDVWANSELSKGAFWKLVSSQKNKIDTLQPEDELKLNSLINWHNAKLDFKKALPSMADDLEHDAKVLGIDPIVLWQPLFAAVMSLVGKKVKLDMQSHMIPAIAWTMTVMESGGGKTRADNVILAPIRKLQSRARSKFLAEMKEFENPSKKLEEGEERPTRPVEEKYLFEVATIQAVMRRASEQPGKRGQLWARDEIGGLFKSLGQFGSGENEGKECLLKMWDGDGVQVDRVHQEDSYVIDQTAISVNGGMQPGIYRDIFKDPNDSQGLTARMLIANPKPLKPKRVKGYCDLSDKLPTLYDWLINLPETVIKPSRAADRYYDNLYNQIGEQAFETSQPAIRAWMYKLPANLLRIALALHFIECYHDRNRDFEELQKDTLQRAVLFAQYYRSAFHIIQETTTDNDDISSILLKIWDAAASKHPDGITTRDAYRNIKAIQYRAKDMGRDVSAYTAELFGMLEAKGRGKVAKNGRTIKFIALIGDKTDPDIDPQPPQPDDPLSDCKSENTDIGDTVTVPGTPTVDELEVSPEDQVSPVTLENSAPLTDDTSTDEVPAFEEPSNIQSENQEVVIPEAELKNLIALILHCKNWVEFAELPEMNQEKIITVVEKAPQRQISYLCRLLSVHLLGTNNFNDLTWLPEKLVMPTLSKIVFTVTRRKLGTQEIEVIRECKMIGTKSQSQTFWTFSAPGTPMMPINGDDDFTVESLISDSPAWG
ncbi:DUF3987 domain-containing protein [Tolypothrix sp. VBCCA 56010]|uniref:DUF3987 domain-containing protein n=1 Tax=Tolypothrix sp. VBCCA 56010 TaxID=3137731 RepID=UPI003D7F16B3